MSSPTAPSSSYVEGEEEGGKGGEEGEKERKVVMMMMMICIFGGIEVKAGRGARLMSDSACSQSNAPCGC